MSDIVERLRNWRTVHLTQLRYVMESAADEIERLRLSQNGDCPNPDNLAAQDILTDEEREAVRWFSDYGDLQSEARLAEVLKGLLERLG